MIILEGPDGSGKTTVIERLGYERRAFKALRGGVGESERGNWGAQDPAPIAYARQILAAHPRVAFDRFHLSETIYGPILRQGSGISDEEVVVLERLLKARGVTTILCLPPAVDTLRNVVKEGRERPAYQTLGFLRKSYLAWERLRDATDRYDVFYNYVAKPDGPWLPTLPTCPQGVVGSPTARYLFVGDRSNLAIDLPFFSMHNCSGFLNRCLWYAGFRESEIALTNAFNAEGRPRDLHASLLASTTHVIALGVEAGTELGRQGIPVNYPIFTAPHPQFWKRFHARNEAAYVDRLREIRESAA